MYTALQPLKICPPRAFWPLLNPLVAFIVCVFMKSFDYLSFSELPKPGTASLKSFSINGKCVGLPPDLGGVFILIIKIF